MKKEQILKVLLVLAMLSFSFVVANPTSADNSNTKDDVNKKLDDISNIIKNHSTALKKDHTNKAKAIKAIHKSIDNGHLKVKGNSENLDFDNLKGQKFDKTQDNVTSVTIPFKNKSGAHKLANLTVFLDSNNHVKRYSETDVKETTDKASSVLYMNGDKMGGGSVDKSKAQKSQNGEGIHTQGISDVNKCMSYYGIKPAYISLAITTCSAACATAVLCAPCVGALEVAGGSAITHCLVGYIGHTWTG